MAGTDSKIDTPLARERSRPVRYELIDKDGRCVRRVADEILEGLIEALEIARGNAKGS